jgi:DNA-directed RNA polymerase beta'' subunit
MKKYIYQNTLVSKKQLRQLLSWTFTNYDSIQACTLADELKYLGFKYASQAGISISIEDLKIPFVKNVMLKKANQEIINAEKIYFEGKMTEVERFQKIIDTWNLTSEALKEQVVYYFKTYDPLNSVYIMAFSGARGNLSQVRQLVGMRGLMSDTSGEIMNLAIKKNFREGLTITDYLMSGYGARKGIVDTALKTANSGYLTRRLIDVGQDILIREKNCFTTHAFLLSISQFKLKKKNLIYEKIVGRVLSQNILDIETKILIAKEDDIITPNLIEKLKEKNIEEFYIRSPLTCNLYRAICQKCYGWDLANENLVDIGEAIGILAGQSIGEPGTQLTMRTFHTGGIFTSQARQQIISPVNGIIKFYKLLKTIVLRSNRGENVLITKSSGSIILIPSDKSKDLVKLEILKNTIIFPKNNQYILKDTVIGEVINKNKQIRTEIKPILNDTCGEIFMPRLKKKVNLLTTNKLIWILSGQLYNSPNNSFLNFYPDYKINPFSYIFRTKILNHFDGFVEFTNKKQNLYQRLIKITNNKYLLTKANLQKLAKVIHLKKFLLNLPNCKYLVNIESKDSKFYLQIARHQQIGIVVTNSFRTLTGGTVYYESQNFFKYFKNNQNIRYISIGRKTSSEPTPIIFYRTMIWLGQEIHHVNCDPNRLFVDQGDFISEKFELIPGLFSKTSGIVVLTQKNNIIQTILIKSGLVYEGKKVKGRSKKIYYPGEIILSNVFIQQLSFCEYLMSKDINQLLLRPIEIFEFPYLNINNINLHNKLNSNSNFKFESKNLYTYQSNQKIKQTKNLNLVSQFLILKLEKFVDPNVKIELVNNPKMKLINLWVSEKLNLTNFIAPNLHYKNIESCLLVQLHQFIDKYTILAYLEALTLNPLEIVKFKIKNKDNKQILLISNQDCFTVDKKRFPEKKVNDLIIDSSIVNEMGKIIIENNHLFTLQKGRPYFFPNCRNEELTNVTNLQYKILPKNRFYFKSKINQNIFLNYYDLMKVSIKQTNKIQKKAPVKIDFPKLFFKKNGKLYSSLVPQLFKKFSICNSKSSLKFSSLLLPNNKADNLVNIMDQTLLFQSSDKVKNESKINNKINSQLTFVKFMEHPFSKTNKSIGLYSITEDYFEQDVNSVFCQNTEFIENGETIGLLNLEKEITGDIVQGLPKIEEILEARKKNIIIKRLPTSQKKKLLVQKTSLDPNFEFRKLGTLIQENDKVNLHKLLKVYFNYYGLMKSFVCDRSKIVQYNRLIQNYEGSYKSFKKVQLFILNSVQSVYESQGVFINDKHLEVIIKQMTTKVLITSEGNTPLLRREVIDLYHIQYINQIMSRQKKQPACYVPFLLGITKAALNNPSFISAASFQETTRVLTKAAIEGRIDWLRGLKENIVIGHLIPAGTGSTNYRHSFKKYLSNKNKFDRKIAHKNNY